MRFWRVVLSVLVIVITYLALTPRPPQQADLGWDKLNHLSAFGALALAACFSFADKRHNYLKVLVALVGYGVAIEAIQSLVPGRFAEGFDVLADALGAVLGILAAQFVRRRSRVKAAYQEVP